MNPLMTTDSYKLGHMAQYPEGTELVYSNFTPRSNTHLNVPASYKDDKIIFFGLQSVLTKMTKMWKEDFFDKDIEPIIEDFARKIAPFVGPSGFDFDKIRELHKYGMLPIEVAALPEGSRVNIGVPVFTIVNTKPEFFWVTNFLETYLSTELWKMSTSATIADVYKRILLGAANASGADPAFVQWQAHDFSMRGLSGIEDAAKSGAAHLTSFNGTDSLISIDFLEEYYSGKDTFIGGSVPATEHSVMTMGGEDNEVETFRRLIQDIYPAGIVSIVSDSWDFWRVLTEYAVELKEIILSRTPDSFGNAKVVFRPDSGDPVKIITGYTESEIYDAEKEGITLSEAEIKGAVEVLWNTFGGTFNKAGFKEVNSRVGLIYGDSITPQRALDITTRLITKGFASSNIVFGVGSYTYQYNTRDTLGFAMKATYGVVNSESREIFKKPKTDSGKNSAKGLLKVIKDGNDFILLDQQDSIDYSLENQLQPVYYEGALLKKETLEGIRERIKNE